MHSRRHSSSFASLLAAFFLWSAHPAAVWALSISTYSSAVNDRFSSGYAFPVTAVVSNTSASFAGLGYDWSGVAWSLNDVKKSFGMISPRHYLVATHWGGASYLQFCGTGGVLVSATQQSVDATGFGPATSGTSGMADPDISLGTLSAPVPASAGVAYYPVLDLVPSLLASNYSSYTAKSYFMYGWTGRVAANTTGNVGISGGGYAISSTASIAAFESGDSGSPAFLPWPDPNGNKHLTILGHNWAVARDSLSNPVTNYHAFLPVTGAVNKLNAMMALQGYALRWVADASTTWTGGTSNSFGTGQNWSGGTPTLDSYAAFSGNTAARRAISLGGNQSLRGMMFLSATAGNFFTIQAGNTLTLGRGGIVNYDPNNTQTVGCNITLSDAQWWDAGKGGLIFTGTIANGGYQLVVDGSGSGSFASTVTGTGGLAKEGRGTWTLAGNVLSSGPLMVHNGTLNFTGTSSRLGGVVVEWDGTLQGNGWITLSSSSVTVLGTLTPGGSAATGTLRIVSTTNATQFADTATLVLKAGNISDRVELNGGGVVLAGTLRIIPGSGFSYAGSYTVFSGLGGTPSGSFSTVTGLADGFRTSFSTESGNYKISFTPTLYSAWQQTWFTTEEIGAGLADDAADPDGDDIKNLEEYALGLNPRTAATVGVPALSSTDGYLTLTVIKNLNATDLTYSVEVTSDLTDAASWNTAQTALIEETSSRLVVRDTVPMTSAPHRFMRLRVTRQ